MDASVISSSCFMGHVMQDLQMQYNSPTLGFYFWVPDYIEFLQHLEFYLTKAKIIFVEHSKYPIGDNRCRAWEHWFPVDLLDGKVEILFLRYHSEEELAEKWYRRASRVNFDKFFGEMGQNLCMENKIRELNALPFTNKYFFSSKNISLPSKIFMKEFENMKRLENCKKGHMFYRKFLKGKKNRDMYA